MLAAVTAEAQRRGIGNIATRQAAAERLPFGGVAPKCRCFAVVQMRDRAPVMRDGAAVGPIVFT
jgi:hypothetical protein